MEDKHRVSVRADKGGSVEWKVNRSKGKLKGGGGGTTRKV